MSLKRAIKRAVERAQTERFFAELEERKADCFVYHSPEFKYSEEKLRKIQNLDNEYEEEQEAREIRMPEKDGTTDVFAWFHTEKARDNYASDFELLILEER